MATNAPFCVGSDPGLSSWATGVQFSYGVLSTKMKDTLMSAETRLIARYVNELATARHSTYLLEDENEQLKTQLSLKDAEISELRQQNIPAQGNPIEGVIVSP